MVIFVVVVDVFSRKTFKLYIHLLDNLYLLCIKLFGCYFSGLAVDY